MSVKIQLNSLEALNRLIGGDNAIELELRETIVQEFARHHLKIFENLVRNIGAEIKAKQDVVINEAVQQSIGSYTPQYNGTMGPIVLKPEMVEKIKQLAFTCLNSAITTYFAEYDTSLKNKFASMEKTIAAQEGRIATIVDERVKLLVDAEFKRRVEEEIQNRLKKAMSGS